MKSFRHPVLTVPVVAVLLGFSPLALSAQAPAVSPTLYAAAEAPASVAFSSSSIAADSDAPAPAAAASFASAAAAAPAAPESSTRPFSAVGVGVKIGLGGIGFDVATPISERLNIRGGAGFFSYNYNGTISNDPVNANLKLNNAEVMLDFFPFHGSFRLAAGLTIYNNTALAGTITTAGNAKVTIGNTSYISDPQAPITGTVSAKFGGNVAPRFTVGWGNLVPRRKHWSFESELGLEIIGTPTVGWTYAGMGCNNTAGQCGSEPNYTTIAAPDVSAQNASLQSDVNGLKVFPIFNIGISYKIGGSH